MYAISELCSLVKEYNLDVILTRCKDHAPALNAAKRYRLKVCHENYLFTDKLLWLIEFCYTRNDLALFISEINDKLQKLLCLRYRLTLEYFSYSEFNRTERINGNLGLMLRLFYRLCSTFCSFDFCF